MILYESLQKADSEEDVKDAYIKALGLKNYQKNLIDIQTHEVWFEAKVGAKNSCYSMFTQLFFYVASALKNGEEIPPFLCVIDSVKAAIMESSWALKLLSDKSVKIKWGKSASDVSKDALDIVSQFIGTHFVTYRIETQEKEFLQAVKTAIKEGRIVRREITPANLQIVFDQWVNMVGRDLRKKADATPAKVEDFCLLFFADIMSDDKGNATHEDLTAELLHKGQSPCFLLRGELFQIGNFDGYRKFWAIYHRPPAAEYRNYLLERRDSLIPTDERSFKGAYYTPLKVVDKAYELLESLLGAAWQQHYVLWDPCCGVGNLETRHAKPHNVFMSTLDSEDVDIMKAAKSVLGAEKFQYDYLNDDINDYGEIDYTITNKVPLELREILLNERTVISTEASETSEVEKSTHTLPIDSSRDGSLAANRLLGMTSAKSTRKKIIVLMNPPYAEAGQGPGSKGGKGTVAKTKVAKFLMGSDWGKSSNELFTQFMARISVEMPNAIIATFSKLKYVNATNFEKFREKWNAKYLGGFVVHSKAFDGLDGDFPIGFLVWQTHNEKNAKKTPITEISCEAFESVFDKDKNLDLKPIGEKKFYNIPASKYLNVWIKRPKANNETVIPVKNAVTVATAKFTLSTSKWSDGAIGYMFVKSNDFQNASQQTALFSSMYGDGHGIYVTPENLLQCAVVFTVRRIVPHTWLNDRDQFLQPNFSDSHRSEAISSSERDCHDRKRSRNDDVGELDTFFSDCLVWMLFSGSNLTAGADGLEWNGKTWSITNHFVPFTESEVGCKSKMPSSFMQDFLQTLKISPEARLVLDAGRELWKSYFEKSVPFTTQQKLKLARADAGWYQIRNALKECAAAGDENPADFSEFDASYKMLTEKIRPKVWEYGFLRE